jgi:NADPH-dependent ferric siderophore reductase
MTTVAESQEQVEVQPWRLFPVQVAAVRRLSPSLVRLTFTGPGLADFADPGLDQRIKLVLPAPGRTDFDGVPLDDGWAGIYQLADEVRPRIRTYTTRAVRTDRREVDVDMVLHGDGGPASRFAGAARPGDAAALLGPDARYDGDHGGLEFRCPDGVPVLLVADETALPAVARILEELPRDATGEAVVEVPVGGDRIDLDAPDGVRVTWLPRDEAGLDPHATSGSLLQAGVVDALARTWPSVIGGPGSAADDLDVDEDQPWEVPGEVVGTDLYAWMAGESGAITGLRRYLVRDLGVARQKIAFMGYWKHGRALDG